MTPEEERLLELAQRIYRTMNKTSNQNIAGSDLDRFLDDTIGWVNDFLPELEAEAYWNFSRSNDAVIGAVTDSHTYELPEDVRTLVIDPRRNLTLQHDGTVISSFKLVDPNQINDPSDNDVVDRATVVGRRILLSRAPREEEEGADIVADKIDYIPRLSREDVSLMDVVNPLQLVVLGVAKNWILPDKVSGGLSQSFTQKYAELLRLCKEENDKTAEASIAQRESFGWIGGVGF